MIPILLELPRSQKSKKIHMGNDGLTDPHRKNDSSLVASYQGAYIYRMWVKLIKTLICKHCSVDIPTHDYCFRRICPSCQYCKTVRNRANKRTNVHCTLGIGKESQRNICFVFSKLGKDLWWSPTHFINSFFVWITFGGNIFLCRKQGPMLWFLNIFAQKFGKKIGKKRRKL
jgi:hypothetical protein